MPAAAFLLLLFQTEPSLKAVADLIGTGKLQEAQTMLSKLDPAAPGTTHLQGVLLYNSGDYARAAKTLESAAEQETPETRVYRESALLLGQSYYLLSQFDRAIPWLEKAQSAGAHPPEVNYMLGNSFLQLRQADRAVAAFAIMFDVPVASASARLLTAQMMVRMDQNELAQEQLRRALELDPKLPGVHQLLGEIATFQSKPDEAVTHLKAELGVNPNSSLAYYKLGDAYTRNEQWEQAIPALQKSIWLNPSQSGPYIILGRCYLKAGQLTNAERMLRHAIDRDPRNYSAHYLLGQTLIRSGNVEEGRQVLKKSEGMKPK